MDSLRDPDLVGEVFLDEQPELVEEEPIVKREVTPADLKLIGRKIPIRFCEYKITNNANKMLQSETISVSNLGIMFLSPVCFADGILMRILVEMPDYWARKSKHVRYRHTSAPSYFQILGRVCSSKDVGKRVPKYQVLCETVNLDPVDELVLCEYLGNLALKNPLSAQGVS